MLRCLNRARLSNASGHPCRTCRHKLLAVQCQRHQWRSYASPSPAHTERDVELVDDYINNFDSLSAPVKTANGHGEDAANISLTSRAARGFREESVHDLVKSVESQLYGDSEAKSLLGSIEESKHNLSPPKDKSELVRFTRRRRPRRALSAIVREVVQREPNPSGQDTTSTPDRVLDPLQQTLQQGSSSTGDSASGRLVEKITQDVTKGRGETASSDHLSNTDSATEGTETHANSQKDEVKELVHNAGSSRSRWSVFPPFGTKPTFSSAAVVNLPDLERSRAGKHKLDDLSSMLPASKESEGLEKLHKMSKTGWGLDGSSSANGKDTEASQTYAATDKNKSKGKTVTQKKPLKEKKPSAVTSRRGRTRARDAAPVAAVAKDRQASGTTTSGGRKAPGRSSTAKKTNITKSTSPANSSDASAGIANDTAAEPASLPPVVLVSEPTALVIDPLDIPQPPVPGLEYDLDRVLFNSGVYQLQDPHTGVFNFDPYLQKIMPVVEFDYNALKEYKTSSQDVVLADIARENNKRYIGSTSSMTGTLGHFHYLLSSFRPINLSMLSRSFPEQLDTFTQINRAPNAIFLRWKNGTYAVDADKEYDGANVLMMLGKSMEKLFTLPTSEFERYRKSDPRSVSEAERAAPESFCYTTMGDFLMRSQLDAYDPRLPGTGMFDLKTRAVVSVRMDTNDFTPMTGYEIQTMQGRFESYEREFYDMMRSTMLKYMLQVRMGRMDGIFIAYHNIERIFGFQYLSLEDMDRALHGQTDPVLGDQEFKISLEMLNKIFDLATAKFPEQSLRFHFEAASQSLGGRDATVMWVFAEPMTEEDIEAIQAKPKAAIEEFERTMMGIEKEESTDENDSEATTTSSDVTSASADVKTQQQAVEQSQPTSVDGSAQRGTSKSSAKAPLFVANIMCQSEVNGSRVVRPEHLQSSDNWKVQYLLQEWDPNESEKLWPMYEEMKARRRDLFARFGRALEEEMADVENMKDDTAEDAKAKAKAEKLVKKSQGYIDMLRSMSKKGRERRNRIDEQEAGKAPVVVGKPVDDATAKVDGVDGYLGWLYEQQPRSSGS